MKNIFSTTIKSGKKAIDRTRGVFKNIMFIRFSEIKDNYKHTKEFAFESLNSECKKAQHLYDGVLTISRIGC